jgi:hypothetical protein
MKRSIILICLICRHFVSEKFFFGGLLLQETLCYGDFLLGGCFVWKRFVKKTSCEETFGWYTS